MDRRGHVHLERRQNKGSNSRVSASTMRTGGLPDDATWLNPVIDDHTQDPPSNPTRGDRYVIPCGATGDWAGRATQIAEWDGSQWLFTTPPPGATVWVQSQLYYLALIDNPPHTGPIITTLLPTRFWFPHHYLDNAHTINPIPVVSISNVAPIFPGPVYSAYLVGPVGEGVWEDHSNEIAITVCNVTNGRSWVFYEPKPGQLIWDQETESYYIYNTDNTWVLLSEYVAAEMDLEDLSNVGGGPANDGDVLTWDQGDGRWEPRSSVHTLGIPHNNVADSVDSAPVNKVLAVVGSAGQWAASDVPPHTHQISDVIGLEDALEEAGGGGGASENIRMIRGRLGLTFPASGAGWTATRLGIGNYVITWTTTVPNDVTLLPSPGTSVTGALFGYSFSPGGTPGSGGFTIAVYRWDGDSWELDDVGLSFLAIWGV